MPIREYRCNGCGKEIEYLIIGSEEDVVCSKCGTKMEKIISQSTFILKGGGWYSEGYSKKEKE